LRRFTTVVGISDSSFQVEDIMIKNIESTGTAAGAGLGAVAGIAGTIATVLGSGAATGASAASIVAGLASMGSAVGGTMITGVAIVSAAPVVVAAAGGYGGYRLAKWYRNRPVQTAGIVDTAA
jgi:hypothetical protein